MPRWPGPGPRTSPPRVGAGRATEPLSLPRQCPGSIGVDGASHAIWKAASDGGATAAHRWNPDGEAMTMSAHDEVTVVVPAYNADRYLAETLRSALASGSSLAEVVVVDDGSTDATAAVVARFQAEDARVTLVRQANGGVARARNAGLARVRTGLVCFLDADDVLRPGGLEALRRCLRDRPDAAACYGRVAYIDLRSDPHPTATPSTRPRRSLGLAEVLAETVVDTPGAVLFRTATVRDVGGFRPGLAIAEDWEMYVRVAAHGALVACADIVLDYRVHPASAIHRASLRMEDFEPALAAVFGDHGRYAGRVEPAALRRCELRSRAHVLLILGQNATDAATGLGLIVQVGRLAVRARLDGQVVGLGVRAVLRCGRSIVRGKRRGRSASFVRTAELIARGSGSGGAQR